ncbi:MAG TPA: hypothetical protein VJT31_08080 [Rugosimonospora sp.]|nr:hypothetical protein [Rugosimonospora sp.]
MSELAEAVLRAAGRISEVDTAYDAELLLSTLLGGVYQVLPPDRGPALDAFVETLREHLSTHDEPNATLVAAVLDGHPAPSPPWAAALGTVRATGGYAFGDRYGDQTSYVATFEYADPELGGPEHAIVVLADHNLGLARDLLVLAPAAPVLQQLRDSALTDPDGMTWLAEVPLSTVRTAANAYLRATDTASEPPATESLPANRSLALARLALLPEAAEQPEPDAGAAGRELMGEFLASPEASLSGLSGLGGPRGESVNYCLGLIVDFATGRGGDPLRWSPQSVVTFLTEWVHQRAVLDNVDAATLPGTLGAWVVWAGRRLDLPDHAVQGTFAQVNAERDEFARLYATGERRSPAAEAMARLVAEGVDLTDDDAVDAWLRTYNAEHG